MSYLSFNPSLPHTLPLICAGVLAFCSASKKIVRAISDFVIFVFQEGGRAVLECRKVVQQVHGAFGDPGIQIAPTVPSVLKFEIHVPSLAKLADAQRNSVTYDFSNLCSELRPLIASKTEGLLAS